MQQNTKLDVNADLVPSDPIGLYYLSFNYREYTGIDLISGVPVTTDPGESRLTIKAGLVKDVLITIEPLENGTIPNCDFKIRDQAFIYKTYQHIDRQEIFIAYEYIQHFLDENDELYEDILALLTSDIGFNI